MRFVVPFFLTALPHFANMPAMKQRYHTIIKPESNGWFVGWVEEVPGTITHGRSLDECRHNLRESLQLMVETHRDEARLGIDRHCILEAIEIDVSDPQQYAQQMA
jgi:predicted RNase H-like HicB family nuclease